MEYYFQTDKQIRCVKMLFGNMTRLRALVLANQDLNDSELPMNMSSFLTHLDLRFTGLQGNLPATIFENPDLQILKLYGNEGLKGSLSKNLNWSNVHSIKELDLARTSISGRLPDSIGFMTNLRNMHLSWCRLWGPIPESIGNITAITSMDLSWNNLSGRLPDAVWGLQNLTQLDISSNAFTGCLPSRKGIGLQHLRAMKFYKNYIHGMIPSWLFHLRYLETLDLSYNRLTGRIGKLNSKSLSFLDLDSNGLTIELESFYNLTNIEVLSISNNIIIEHGSDTANVTFPQLDSLGMSSCGIKEFPNILRGVPFLAFLDLSNNSIYGAIPNWWESLQYLFDLDLSSNFLTYAGYLPLQSLRYLYLQSNSLRGTFPLLVCSMIVLETLDLSNNKLSGNVPECLTNSRGTFPLSVCNMTVLETLDLSNNKLSGNVPECLTNSSYLKVLDLSKNKFHEKIPTTIGAMYSLASLGLNENHLEGSLPLSLANCSLLEVVDFGNNMIHDTFPWWLHTLPLLKIIILKSNRLHGSITSPAFSNDSFTSLQIFDLSYNNFTGLLPEKLFASFQAIKNQSQVPPDGWLYLQYGLYMPSVALSVKGEDVELTKVLKILTTIDLSNNNFEGHIPNSLSNLTSLWLLNQSNNSIRGNIPPAFGRLVNLEQLDLSCNQLWGSIPQTLANLTFLGTLNLSHNHLVGPIPQGNQFLTFSNDSYVGNSGLCGAPLTRSCGNERGPPSPGEFEEEDEDDEFMMGFTWKAVVIGYGCGIVLGFLLGNVMMYMENQDGS